MTKVKMSALYHELLSEMSRGAVSTHALKLDLTRARAGVAAQAASRNIASVIGKVLHVQDGIVHGWAMDTDNPYRQVPVSARVNGRTVATAVADVALPIALAKMLPSRFCADKGFALTCLAHRRQMEAVVDVVAGDGECELATDLRLYGRGTRLRATVFDGYSDPNSKGVATGWVWNTEDPERHYDVIIVVEGEPVAWAIAGRYRGDLADAHIGAGDHAFAVPLPEHVFDNRPRPIQYVVAENGLRLPGGPMLICDRHIFAAPKPRWRAYVEAAVRMAGART